MSSRILTALLLLMWVLPVRAAPESGVTGWDQLAPQEQKILQRFQDQWDRFSPDKQARLLNGARQWSQLYCSQRCKSRAFYLGLTRAESDVPLLSEAEIARRAAEIRRCENR